MFDLERFVAECRNALAADQGGPGAVREVVAAAVADPAGVMAGLGEPRRAGLTALHSSSELTILHLVWGPRMMLMPHNHRMWAVIGIYTGREDNIFWRRVGEPGKQRIEAAGARSLCTGDCEVLGRDIVHSVSNPIPRLTGTIHVYGGDFFAAERSEWDAETLREQPLDVRKTVRMFEESNAAAH